MRIFDLCMFLFCMVAGVAAIFGLYPSTNFIAGLAWFGCGGVFCVFATGKD